MSTNATCLQLNRLDQRRDLFLGHHIPFSFITNDTLSTERKQQRWPQLANGARQSVLLLKGPKQQYTLQTDYAVPSVSHQSEILVKVTVPVLLTMPAQLNVLGGYHRPESRRLESAVC